LFPLARLLGLDADAEIESVVEISDDQPKAYMEGEGVYVRLICTAEEYRPLR
jgi:NOL1/NOP2/fmu family ribosome biogenesis protein